MTRSFLTTPTLAIALFACGSSDPSGLYEPRQTGSDSGLPIFSGSGGSTEQDASSTGGTGGGSKPPEQGPPPPQCDGDDDDDDESDCGKCKEDKTCAPLICNKQLHQCMAPAGPGVPCDRDLECVSDECKEGHCQ